MAEQPLERDKSQSMSDSGDVIDLSAVDSDRKEEESLSDKSKGDVEPQGKADTEHNWLTDMDHQMKDMKLIEEEEFDFDIPPEFLDISLEVEQQSSSIIHDDSLSPSSGLLSVNKDQPLVHLHTSRGRAVWVDEPAAPQELPKEFNPQPLCVVDGASTDDIDVFIQSCQTGRTGSSSNKDLIAFTPLEPPTEDDPNCVTDRSSPVLQPVETGDTEPVLEKAVTDITNSVLEGAGTNITSVVDTDCSPVLKTDGREDAVSLPVEEVHPVSTGDCELNRSSPTDFVNGGVCCSPGRSPAVERRGLGSVSSSRSEADSSRNSSTSLICSKLPTPKQKCSIVDSSPVKCSQLEELRALSQAIKKSSSKPILLQDLHNFTSGRDTDLTVGGRAGINPPESSVTSQSVPASQSTRAVSSSCSGSSSSGDLDNSASSGQSKSSGGSRCSQAPRLGGCGPRKRRLVGERKIALVGSRSKLMKPQSKLSLLPSNIALPSKLPRKAFGKTSLLEPGAPKLVFRSSSHGNLLRPKSTENCAVRTTKPSKLVRGPKDTYPIKMSTQSIGDSKDKPRILLARRNAKLTSSRVTNKGKVNSAPGSSPGRHQPSSSETLLTPSVVSPPSKQSTPIGHGNRANTIPVQPPEIGLSSIKPSVTTPNGKLQAAPEQTDETSVNQAGSGRVPCTPNTVTKKRRSFIPTPVRERPVPRPVGLRRPQKPGQRDMVLGVRNGRKTRAEGPVKPKQTFAFGGYDSEVPMPRAKVVHSPIDKENRPATPHSRWSPIKKRSHVLPEDDCFRCTKHINY